jgi:uncharacterized protein (TIGR02271 family)
MEQPMEFVPMPGAVIEASDGYLGRVEQVLANPDNQEPNYLVTQPNPTGERLTIPLDLVGEDSRPDMVYLKVTGAEARRQAGVISETDWQGNGRMVLPVVEERLEVSKRPVEVGELLVHKSVEEYEDTANLDLTRDHVEIERVAVNRPLEEPAQTRQEGDWLIIPVMQEVLVVQKQLMLTEEIRIRKRQITEPKEVRETLRREHVELENKKNL